VAGDLQLVVSGSNGGFGMRNVMMSVMVVGLLASGSSAWAESAPRDVSTACACDDDCVTVFGPNAKCNNGVCSQSGAGTPCVTPDGGPTDIGMVTETAPPSPDIGPQSDVGTTKQDAGPVADVGGFIPPDGFCGCEAGVPSGDNDDSGGCAVGGGGGGAGASLSLVGFLLLGLALLRRR
jgi:hypothetical protein